VSGALRELPGRESRGDEIAEAFTKLGFNSRQALKTALPDRNQQRALE
jgi:hypothetical protein